MRRTIAILTAAGLIVPLAAHAMNERVWLMLNGGGGTYVMSDLNAEVDAANSAYGWSFQRVNGGRSFGAAIGVETAGRWNLGVGFDRLEAATRTSDPTVTVEYQFTANAWRAFGEYALRPVGRSTLFVGAALGLVDVHGLTIVSSPGYAPSKNKITGGDPSYEGYLGGTLWVTSKLGVSAIGGYRVAKVSEIQVNGYPFIMTNGETMSLDYTGPTARFGIKLAGGGQ